jgi:hypothetical protein
VALTAIVASGSAPDNLVQDLTWKLRDVERDQIVHVGHYVASTPHLGQGFELHYSVLVLIDPAAKTDAPIP